MPVGTTAFPTALDTALELVEQTNNASSTLGAAVLVAATTVTVADPGEFPNSGFATLVDDLTTPTKIEIISWTGKSGSNLTGVLKGRQGTADQAWNLGDFIEIRANKGPHEAVVSAIQAIQAKFGYGASTPTANTVLLGNGVGTSAFGAITNAYIDAAAAIAHSKMAALTASRLMVTDGSGFSSVNSVTATEAGHLAGVTSAIQTQINGKQTAFGDQAANVVYAGPATGAAAAPAFRALVAADIPDLSGVYSVSGHTHSYQASDATLTALAAYATNGLLTQTAADTFTGRTITGTTNVIDVSNGDGVAGNPTITISATYVGQTSITTLGAIGTGTWNGAAIGAQYGGTGINTSAASGYPSVSTGTWSIVSAATLTAALDVLVGDSGAGGTKGLVPAPAAGDAVAGKFLKADGTWTAPSGSGDVVGPASATDNAVARFDTTTGKLLQNSAVTIADTSGNMAGVGTLNTHTLPGGTDTFAMLAATQTLTNKTITAATNVLGGVTMTLGSDADGDIYYRASGVLTRLAKGTASQVLTMNAGATAPEWAAAGGGGLTVGTSAIASGTAGRILYETSGNVLGEIAGSSADASGAVQFAASARTSGVAQYFRVNTPADTTLTASTQSVGIYFGGDGSGSTVTREWSTGALTAQREYVFVAPTYAFAGASTLTTASTVSITGPPIAGTNATLTNRIGLNLDAASGVTVPSAAALAIGNNLASSGSVAVTGLIRLGPPTSNTIFTIDYARDASSNNILGIGRTQTGASQTRVELLTGASASNAASLVLYGTSYSAFSSTQQGAVFLRTLTSTSGSGKVGFLVQDESGGRFGIVGNGVIIGTGRGNTTSSNTANAELDVVSGSASRVGLRVDSAASPTAPIMRLTNNGTMGYEFWGSYWQVQKEATTDPTATELTDGDHFSIYRKNNKFVIAYNNGGTITYLTAPLDGSTNTWTQSTTAP